MGKWDGDKVLYRTNSYVMSDKEIAGGWAILVVSNRTNKEVGTYRYEKGDYFSRQRSINKARIKMNL